MLQNNVKLCAHMMKGDKPCIALMGEFSAGKTTLINFLLGEDILPTQVTATHVPPVWISYGTGEPFYIDSDNHQHPVDLNDIQALDVANVRYIKIFSDAEILKQMDLIDTPGISDPNIPEFHKDTAIENADAVIWCTHATQAWRESERSTWVALPEEFQANSILLATRSDKLDERNRERVRRRLAREAGDLFGHIIMFSATDAIIARDEEDLVELLESSGGQALQETLQTVAAEIVAGAGESGSGSGGMIRPMRVQRVAGRGRDRNNGDEAGSLRARKPREADTGYDGAEVTPLVLGIDSDTIRFRSPEDEAAQDAEGLSHEDDAAYALEMQEEAEDSGFDAADVDVEEAYDDAEYASEDDDDTDEEALEAADDDADDAEYASDEDQDDDQDDEAHDDTARLASIEEMLRASRAADPVVEPAPEMVTPEPVAAVSARALWDQVLAQTEVQSMDDVLMAIGAFADALDAHGLLPCASSDNSSVRK